MFVNNLMAREVMMQRRRRRMVRLRLGLEGPGREARGGLCWGLEPSLCGAAARLRVGSVPVERGLLRLLTVLPTASVDSGSTGEGCRNRGVGQRATLTDQ